MATASSEPGSRSVRDGPRRSAAQESARSAGQPVLGLAGVTLVVPVAVALGVGLGNPERSLLVLGPISTFALPVIAMIAFWWDDWPGTMLRAPLAGVADTALVAGGGVAATIAGQAVVSHVSLRAVFDPTVATDVQTFPATMPLAGAIFVAMLQLTLVSEGWPLRGRNRFIAGVVALAAAWAAGVALYQVLVRAGTLSGADFGALIVCIGALQVVVYVVFRGWPFSGIGLRAVRLITANTLVIAGGCLAALLLRATGLTAPTISAGAGSVVAAGLVVGMLFDGWLDAQSRPVRGRVVDAAAVTIGAAVLYVGLQALAHAAHWTQAAPEEWTAYAGLNAIGAGVILHVAIGRRWPFAGYRALSA